MKRKNIILLSLTLLLSGCNNYTHDDLIWIKKGYNLSTYVELSFSEYQKKITNKEDFIMYYFSESCMSCLDFKKVINSYIEKTDLIIYAINVDTNSDDLKYDNIVPKIELYNDGVIKDDINFLDDEKCFSSVSNLESYIDKEVKIMKSTEILNENDLFSLISSGEKVIIYYHFDGCPDCYFFDDNFLNEYIRKDDSYNFYSFDVGEKFLNRENSSDPYWLDFTNKIGISSSSNVGYLNGVIPTFAKYVDGKIDDMKVIFNDVLKETLNDLDEVESVTVTSSYYEDNPFLNKTFNKTDEETARTVYKKSTLEYYKSKFFEIFGE